MTTIDSTNSSTASATTTAARNTISSLDINDFITLMTTQLKYQDPTNPQDSSEFVAQLAQFSSVSGIQEMNDSMTTLLDSLRSSQALNATSLVGHEVLVKADSMHVEEGAQVNGAIETPEGAASVNITVTDASGQIVKQLSVPASEGLTSFNWDGTDDSGAAVEAGEYSFTAIANVNGKSESAETLLSSKVSSVTIDPATSTLQLNTSALGSVTLSDVRQVI